MAEKSITFLDLAEELRNERHFQAHDGTRDEPLKLLFTCGGVKMARIQENGTVSTVNFDYNLKICHSSGANRSCILQVLDDNVEGKSVWIYPLIPNVSPCLRKGRALIFPDLFATDDSSIVILIEDAATFDCLSEILFGPPLDACDSIAEHILKVAFIVSKHCIENAERTNALISKGTFEFTKTVPKSTTEIKLSEKLIIGLEIAKCTSKMAVAITNALASTMQVAKIGLSHYLARQIAKHGAKLVPDQNICSHLHDKRLEDIIEICMSLNEAHLTVEKGLNEAAAVLRKSLNENSLVLVEHIYGQPTAKAIREAIETKHNTKQIAANLERIMMTPKDVAKQVVNSAARELFSATFGNKRKIEGGDSTDSRGSTSKKRKYCEEKDDATDENDDHGIE